MIPPQRAWLRRARSLRYREPRRNVLVEGVLHPVPRHQPTHFSLADVEPWPSPGVERDGIPLENKKLQNELADPTVSQGLSHLGSVLNHVKVPHRAARRGIRPRISSTQSSRACALPTAVPLMLNFRQLRTARPCNPEPKSTTDPSSGVAAGVMMFCVTPSSSETHPESPATAPP